MGDQGIRHSKPVTGDQETERPGSQGTRTPRGTGVQ